MRLRSGDKHHRRKSADRKAQISPVSRKNSWERLPDLCFSICRFSQVMFIPRAQPHAQSLFLFPIVFGINLIHFFDAETDGEGRCSRKFDRLFWCFDPLSHNLTEAKRRTRTVSKSATFLATENVNSAPFKRGDWLIDWYFYWKPNRLGVSSYRELRCNFLARKSAKLFANTKVQIFGKERCKIHRQFQRY